MAILLEYIRIKRERHSYSGFCALFKVAVSLGWTSDAWDCGEVEAWTE